jgi:hypothetical protein
MTLRRDAGSQIFQCPGGEGGSAEGARGKRSPIPISVPMRMTSYNRHFSRTQTQR